MIPADLLKVVFILRQSPDWFGLAQDYTAGGNIDPTRYKPPMHIEGFPPNIEECIAVWNTTFTENFFHCRAVLKTIAHNLLKKVPSSLILQEYDIPSLPSLLETQAALFFMDDDDWFSPYTFEVLSKLHLAADDVLVFPLVRFDTDTFTFIRESEDAAIIVGRRQNFHFRFQTNNYALGDAFAFSEHISSFKDHVVASHTADSLGLPDRYIDQIISATNKTPCSASKLPALVADPACYIASMREYVHNLKQLEIPEALLWCKAPLAETIELFENVLASMKKNRGTPYSFILDGSGSYR